MKSSVLRKVSALTLAGTVVFGASACTTVSSSSSKSSGKAAASSAAGGASDKASSASGSAGGGSSSSDSSSSSSDDGGSSGDSGLKTGKVGEEVKTSYYTAEVNKITDNAKASDDYETPKAGTRYVDVNVKVKNTGKDKLSMSDGYLSASLSDDTEIDGSFVSGIGTDIGFKDLYSGDTIAGDITFEVPQGKTIKSLTFKPISIAHSSNEEDVRINVK